MRRILAVALMALGGCAGEAGADGMDGAYAVQNLYCSTLDDGLRIEYHAVDYSNGDMQVGCSVSDAYAESSDGAFYLADQPGAGTGYCQVTLDVSGEPTGGYWVIQFDGVGLVAEYNDLGDPSDGYTVAIEDADCVFGER